MSLYPNRHASTVALVAFDELDYGNHTVKTQAPVQSMGNFIPEIWSDEIIASYKANLVMSSMVNKVNLVDTREFYLNDVSKAIAEKIDNDVMTTLTGKLYGFDSFRPRGADENIIPYLDRTSGS